MEKAPKKKKIPDSLEKLFKVFEPMKGNQVQIEFGPHCFLHHFDDVSVARLVDMRNPPDKRLGEDGKYHTPRCFQLHFGTDRIQFVEEDIDGPPRVSIYGIIITMKGGATFTMRYPD